MYYHINRSYEEVLVDYSIAAKKFEETNERKIKMKLYLDNYFDELKENIMSSKEISTFFDSDPEYMRLQLDSGFAEYSLGI